jgi:hypothetical protein
MIGTRQIMGLSAGQVLKDHPLGSIKVLVDAALDRRRIA